MNFKGLNNTAISLHKYWLSHLVTVLSNVKILEISTYVHAKSCNKEIDTLIHHYSFII